MSAKTDGESLRDSWLPFTRRGMIKSFLAFAVLSQIPVTGSCGNRAANKKAVFDERQWKMVRRIQQILFPDDGFGPGAGEIHAGRYLEWVLSDERLDPEDREYIYKGLRWIDETADEDYKSAFLTLSPENQEKLIKKVSLTDWGESWLSVMLNYIVEALLADPQYGGNPEGKGWKWLSHYPGYPRPRKDLLYPVIFETVKKEYEQKI